METMKKQWGKPLTSAQEFTPQEYVAVCPPSDVWVTYEFWCDASISSYFGDYALHVYFDDGDEVFDSGDTSALPRGWTYSPCGKTHDVTVRRGESIDNVFPKGWIVPLNGITGEEMTSRAKAVRIYQPKPVNYTDTHCTFQLHESEFIEKNPS